MRRADKAAKIVEILESLYPETPIPLDHTDPYTLLVAVMLSAQTTDKLVNQVTPALFDLASGPEAMAVLPVDTIRELIRRIGLSNTKAKNLVRLSQLLVSEFGSEVPADIDALETLPGVGHKTAQVVMAQAFGAPAFAVDTHVFRLATRWGLSNGRNVVQAERDLKRTFDRSLWSKLHLQMIFFGREYCPARSHDLTGCPICGWASTKKRIRLEMKGKR